MSADVTDEQVAPGTPGTANGRLPRATDPQRWCARRAPEWLVTAGVGVLAAPIGAIAQWQGTFYYVGDNPRVVHPAVAQGRARRCARAVARFRPDRVDRRNLVGEAAYGCSTRSPWPTPSSYPFDDLSPAAATVMVEFLAILAMGTYLLAREYGAPAGARRHRRHGHPGHGLHALVRGVRLAGRSMAFTWVTHFWWSARRHARPADPAGAVPVRLPRR